MKRASKFAVTASWKLLLSDMQIDAATVLAWAGLPADLLNRGDAVLTPAEYFELWRGIERAAGDREVAVLLADHFSAEVFDAPIFASLCSPDFNTAAKRLSRYKPLIGPMVLDVDQDGYATHLTLSCYGQTGPLPRSLSLSELVFLTQLIRVGTRERIVPLSVASPQPPENADAYEHYFGCRVDKSEHTEICFAAADAAKPFLTVNTGMWRFFEGELNQKLADLGTSAGTGERVRAVLLEALPGGDASIESVASRLAMSKRTLQRKLTAEAESFQALLNSVRAELADHYLEKSHFSLGEIAYLLGFQESNSFNRAYREWKGTSPGQYREQFH